MSLIEGDLDYVEAQLYEILQSLNKEIASIKRLQETQHNINTTQLKVVAAQEEDIKELHARVKNLEGVMRDFLAEQKTILEDVFGDSKHDTK